MIRYHYGLLCEDITFPGTIHAALLKWQVDMKGGIWRPYEPVLLYVHCVMAPPSDNQISLFSPFFHEKGLPKMAGNYLKIQTERGLKSVDHFSRCPKLQTRPDYTDSLHYAIRELF